MPQNFAPPLINNQLFLHITDNTCVMEDGNNWNHSTVSLTQQLICWDSAQQHVSPQWGIIWLARTDNLICSLEL